jgi:hypothetical protein
MTLWSKYRGMGDLTALARRPQIDVWTGNDKHIDHFSKSSSGNQYPQLCAAGAEGAVYVFAEPREGLRGAAKHVDYTRGVAMFKMRIPRAAHAMAFSGGGSAKKGDERYHDSAGLLAVALADGTYTSQVLSNVLFRLILTLFCVAFSYWRAELINLPRL